MDDLRVLEFLDLSISESYDTLKFSNEEPLTRELGWSRNTERLIDPELRLTKEDDIVRPLLMLRPPRLFTRRFDDAPVEVASEAFADEADFFVVVAVLVSLLLSCSS